VLKTIIAPGRCCVSMS